MCSASRQHVESPARSAYNRISQAHLDWLDNREYADEHGLQ
jgi:hypothetical protein